MKIYYLIAAVITIINVAAYAILSDFAYLRRGYHAHGGEYLLLFFGFFAAGAVMFKGFVLKKNESHEGD